MTIVRIIKEIFQDIRNSKKGSDLMMYSLFWMVLSAVAAYPSLCLEWDTSVFYLDQTVEYQKRFLLPMLLFLGGFMFDFSMSTQDLEIGLRRGRLYKCLVFALVVIVVLWSLFIIVNDEWAKIMVFIFMWATISIIKGITILISWSDKNIVVTQPWTKIK